MSIHVLVSMQTPPSELAVRDSMVAGILNKYALSTRETMSLLIFTL